MFYALNHRVLYRTPCPKLRLNDKCYTTDAATSAATAASK